MVLWDWRMPTTNKKGNYLSSSVNSALYGVYLFSQWIVWSRCCHWKWHIPQTPSLCRMHMNNLVVTLRHTEIGIINFVPVFSVNSMESLLPLKVTHPPSSVLVLTRSVSLHFSPWNSQLKDRKSHIWPSS